ncbi:MAG: hypothetical protein IJ511_10335 [Bacteroides sp.]|nr:hypothetical protein [Bacteroides sp.]
MAKRRELKKKVNYIASELFVECLLQAKCTPDADREKVDKLLSDILDLQNEFLARISHTEPGNVKGFYKKLHSDFNNQVENIIAGMSELN